MKLYRNLCEAVIAGLQEIFDEKKYADKVIEKILKSNPRWGARDRRFIAETIYDIVRWYRLFRELAKAEENEYWKLLAVWCLWNKTEFPDWEEMKGVDRKKVLARYEEVKSERKIRESIPDWMDELCENEIGANWTTELEALNEEASVVLRTNTLKISRHELQQQLEEEEIITEAPAEFPDGLLLEQRQNIFTRQAFKDGLFEVQDAGSQLIAPFLQVKPGMRVVDACAGAGGKALHLAALMNNQGRIIAMDTEEWKLTELKKRARRAGVGNIETRVIESSKTIKRLENSADRLLLDVPCSGLGVLKRNPDAKWKLTPDFIDRVRELQQHILQDYSNIIKAGGVLVYSTCSLLPSENEEQVKKFLLANSNFELEEEKSVMPSSGFDGFYMARIKRK
ncbi:MAG: RsmB/NOP family class I SAM-dependent RNA methyltransferase [Cyclobacteriaceae bacterium]|nr:RsmB/NOP family class I SAM-dependent RNA methyltransferase [Flammeovirgaceae bacterium]